MKNKVVMDEKAKKVKGADKMEKNGGDLHGRMVDLRVGETFRRRQRKKRGHARGLKRNKEREKKEQEKKKCRQL